jgi:hypothetical protein
MKTSERGPSQTPVEKKDIWMYPSGLRGGSGEQVSTVYALFSRVQLTGIQGYPPVGAAVI